MKNQKVVSPDIMDSVVCAEWLGTSVSTLKRMVAEGAIPYFLVGKRVRFSKAALADWMQNQR